VSWKHFVDCLELITYILSFFENVARLAGFEPTTPWFVAKYSIQLSYSRVISVLYSLFKIKASFFIKPHKTKGYLAAGFTSIHLRDIRLLLLYLFQNQSKK
jgi:hypothetical protein